MRRIYDKKNGKEIFLGGKVDEHPSKTTGEIPKTRNTEHQKYTEFEFAFRRDTLMIDELITAAMYGRQGDRLQSACGIGFGNIYLFYFVMIMLFMFMFMFMGGRSRIHIQVKLLL